MIHLAFFHHSMIVGGSEKVLLNMLNALDYFKYDVTLFLPDAQGGFFSAIPPQVRILYYSKESDLPDASAILKASFKSLD